MNSTSGVWVPTDREERPEPTRVRQWAAQDWESPAALGALDDLDTACLQKWIRLSPVQWEPALQDLDATELVRLIQLLTLAEAHVPGCEAGDRSAAIHAFHQHRSRWGKPDKSLLRWIRANSDNRFLPYGPAL